MLKIANTKMVNIMKNENSVKKFMKLVLVAAMTFVMTFSLAACDDTSTGSVDVDMTELSTTMIYSEVSNMVGAPDDYRGKTVKMTGTFTVYQDESTGKNYYGCIVMDSTACCSQGLEFVLKDEGTYPDDYPAEGEEITVTGTFDTYDEGEYMYCYLKDATLA